MNRPKRFIRKALKYLFALSVIFVPMAASAAWNPSYIVSDAEFSASGTMTEAQIQDFLFSKNSYLTYYNETRDSKIGPDNDVSVKGWRASRIIYQCAQWYGLNPEVILATLQKEQSLVTTTTLNQYGIDWAMGYAVPDSGDRDYTKQGFSMQVDWGTWQLSWNKDKANTECAKVSPYCTGNTVTIDSVGVYMGNGATASLYRYTPHFHGNENFYNIYTAWFNPYDYTFVNATNPPSSMTQGQTATVQVRLKNTGSVTWYNSGTSKISLHRLPVGYGCAFSNWDSTYWIDNTRIKMVESSVAPGEIGTFRATYVANVAPGTYTDRWVPHILGKGLLKDIGMQFTTRVNALSYKYVFASATNPPTTMTQGQTATAQIKLKNTGTATWYNSGTNPTRLLRLPEGYGSFFSNWDSTWADNTQIKMVETSVAPGQIATFKATYVAKAGPGTYTDRWVPYTVGRGKMADTGMQFTIRIRGLSYDYVFAGATNPPATMTQGQTATVQIRLKNTGTATWRNSGSNLVSMHHLPVGYGSFFSNWDSTWIDNTRFKMVEASVAPGATATFRATYVANVAPGTYTDRWVPHVLNNGFMKDVGMQFAIRVVAR